MKFIPILFSTPMVQAIKDGRKKMTRRAIKHEMPNETMSQPTMIAIMAKDAVYFKNTDPSKQGTIFCGVKSPYGQPGDILWVRETFVSKPIMKRVSGIWEPFLDYYFKADGDPNQQPGYDKVKWKPGIHMPKAACRIFLKVKSLRAERLQDITEQDAIAEGVLLHERGKKYFNYLSAHYKVTQFVYNCRSAIESFASLWTLLNGIRDDPFAFYNNTWVWVIEFERVELTLSQREIFLNEQH